MLRKALCLFLILSTVALELSACRQAAVPPAGERSEEELDELLEKDVEVQEMIAIRDDLLRRAIDRNLSSDDIVLAAESNDILLDARLLGYAPDEAAAIRARIETLRSSVMTRYPELERMAREAGPRRCPDCGVEVFAGRWSEIKTAAAAAAPAREPLKCRTSQLILGFAMCAATTGGLLLYVICAYIVFCHNCEGGMAEVIC